MLRYKDKFKHHKVVTGLPVGWPVLLVYVLTIDYLFEGFLIRNCVCIPRFPHACMFVTTSCS
jgi:hypothetical protein